MNNSLTPIYVNGRFLTQPVTGVQRFAGNLVRRLAEDDRFRLVVLTPPTVASNHTAVCESDLEIRTIGRLDGHLWEQISLPAFMHRQTNRGLLLSLTNTGPLRYRNQIFTHHDVAYVRHPEAFSLAFRTFYRVIASSALRRCLALITVSEFSRAELQAVYGKLPPRVCIVPNAVDPNVFYHDDSRSAVEAFRKYAPHSGKIYMVLQSGASYKNVDEVIRFFEKLPSSSAPASLIVVGDRTSRVFASRQDGEARGVANVEFVGRVDDDELRALYSHSDGLIFPSSYEGFGLPPLEAQACGCPVIACKLPPLIESLDHNLTTFINGPTDLETAIFQSARRSQSLSSPPHKWTWQDSKDVLANLIVEQLEYL